MNNDGLARIILAELTRQTNQNNDYIGTTPKDPSDPDHLKDVMIDGHIDLLQLAEALSNALVPPEPTFEAYKAFGSEPVSWEGNFTEGSRFVDRYKAMLRAMGALK